MDNFTLKAILSAVDNLSPVLKGVQNAAKSTRKYLGDVGTSINGLTAKFGVPLGIASTIAAGFGIGAIKHAVVSFAELGEEIQKGAFKAGMSIAEFQRMKYVAEQAGVNVETLGMSMGKLNKNLGTAAMGKNAGLLDLMKTLKVPMKDANGQLRSAADLLPQLADAFTNNKDPIKQAAIGTALFGKAYQEMLPFLNEGSDGIKQSLERFSRLKGIIPDEDIKGAKEFGDKLADVAFVTKGFQMTIARELLPVLAPMVEGFIQWAAAGKKVVGAEVKAVVQELVAGIKSIDWEGFLAGIRSSFDAIKSAVNAVGGLRNALVILALVMNAQTILAIGGIVGALWRLGIVAGAGLFGKLGLLAKANIWLGTSFVWLRTRALAAMLALRIGGVGAIWSGIASAVSAVGGALLAAGRAAFLFGRALLFSPLGIVIAIAAAAYLIYTNWDRIKTFFVGLPAILGNSWNTIAAVASAAWEAVSGAVGEKWTQLVAVVSSGAALVTGLLTQWAPVQWVRAAWDPVMGYFRGLWETITGFIRPIVNTAGWLAGKVGAAFNWPTQPGAPEAPAPAVVRSARAAAVAAAPLASVAPLASAAASTAPAAAAARSTAQAMAPIVVQPLVRLVAPNAPLAATARSTARAAAPVAEATVPRALPTEATAAAPAGAAGSLGTGTFNLVQPAQATLTGKVDINFKNAPPGMQVEQAKTSAPRVAVNTNVGYRSLATDTGF